MTFFSDIDECGSSNLHNCAQLCNNIDGGFECSCNEGYNLQEDRISCNGKTKIGRLNIFINIASLSISKRGYIVK